MPRPFVLLSAAVSLDGYLDDTSPQRLMLSNAADFDRVDQLRAESDAILVGAETIRRDNPRLMVRSEARRAARVAAGLPADPLKVTLTRSGDLDRALMFWHCGGARVVYTTDAGAQALTDRLAGSAEVVSLGPEVDFGTLLDDLGARGIGRLMVEGGGRVHAALLGAGLADELQLAVAPIMVGERGAPRFRGPSGHRMQLAEVRQLDDVALLRYVLQPSRANRE